MHRTHLTRFVIVGLTTNGLLLLAFWWVTSLGMPALMAVSLTYALGLVSSLLLNGRWTFGALNRETAIGSSVRFTALYLVGYLYSVAAFWLLALSQLAHIVIQVIVMFSCAGLLFIGQKYWVFKTRNVDK